MTTGAMGKRRRKTLSTSRTAAPLGEAAVFAAIDSDRPSSAPFLAKHAVNVWPTLYVLDPADDSVLGMWQGAASLAELRNFVGDAAAARAAALGLAHHRGPAQPAAGLTVGAGAAAGVARGVGLDVAVEGEGAAGDLDGAVGTGTATGEVLGEGTSGQDETASHPQGEGTGHWAGPARFQGIYHSQLLVQSNAV